MAPSADKWNVRALVRGLEVLRALNRLNGASINQLAALTKISRATTFRLTKTLEAIGYVRFDAMTRCYYPTILVSGLGKGFDDDVWVRDIAAPMMRDVTKKIKWPLGLSTLHGMMLVMRTCTDDDSPFALKRYSPGHRIDIVRSASGMILLAFCEHEQSDMLVRLITDGQIQTEAEPFGKRDLMVRIEQVRRAKFAVATRPLEGEIGLAVPILVGGEYFASLGLRYIASAMSQSQAKAQYLPVLRDLAPRIGKAIEAL